MSFSQAFARKAEIKQACVELVKTNLLKDVINHLRENIFRKFDSQTMRDTDEMLLLKSQLEGLKLIQRSIEEIASIKTQ